MVGVDDSPAAQVALDWAARDTEMRKIPLTLVHAISPDVATWLDMPLPPGLARWQNDHGRRLLDEATKVIDEACRHGGPSEVRIELLASAAVPTLVDLSKDAKMVVTASRSRSRSRGK